MVATRKRGPQGNERHRNLPDRWFLLYLAAPAAYALAAWLAPAEGPARLAVPGAYFAAGLMATLALLVGLHRRRLPLACIGLEGGPRWRDAGLALLGFGLGSLAWPMAEGLAEAFGAGMFWDGFAGRPRGAWTFGELAFIVAGPVLIAPFVEEVWFRGFALPQLRERGVSTVAAVAAVGVVFGLLHLYGGIGFAIFAGLWSVAPSVAFLRTRTLWAPLGMHALNNAFGFLVVPLLEM